MGALDALLAQWRAQPNAELTLAVCAELRRSPNGAVLREVGALAERELAGDLRVLLALGRRYLEAGWLPEAQTTLVQAGRLDPKDPRPFRLLGEVLLRRGDAVRAEKVLLRAHELGLADPETERWLSRARALGPRQTELGAAGVAAEVAREFAVAPSPSLTPAAPSVSPSLTPAAPSVSPSLAPEPAARPVSVAPGAAARPSALGSRAASKPPVPAKPPLPRSSTAPAASRFRAPAAQLARQTYGEASAVEAVARAAETPLDPHAYEDISSIEQHAPAQRSDTLDSHATLARRESAAVPAAQGGSSAAAARGGESPRRTTASARWTNEEAPDADPHVVLEQLARVGVYEPRSALQANWEPAPPRRSRGAWVLGLSTLLVLVSGGAGYAYAQRVKAERSARAVQLGDEVAALLASGRVEDLERSEGKLGAGFDLDSHSPRLAKLWLDNRVLSSLLAPHDVTGIDAAVFRARQVGVPEGELAAGRLAAHLEEGDTQTAVSRLGEWDRRAERDALYQLTAGVALERAGDPGSTERFERAVALDPELGPARLFLARARALQGQLAPGREPAPKPPTDSELVTRALSALSAVVSGTGAPGSFSEEERRRLPAPLQIVPALARAGAALRAGQPATAVQSLEQALPLSDSPALASRIGFLALAAGTDKLARQAAERALGFAPTYPGSRFLLARVALLAGRSEDAKRAIEGLDPSAPEALVVRAVAAYEALDPGELKSAAAPLASAGLAYAALTEAEAVLAGHSRWERAELEKMADPAVVWGELVSVDAALNEGDVDHASLLVSRWSDASRPPHALRVARLRRYQGKPEEAAELAARSLATSTTSAALIEAVYARLEQGQPASARELLARYPAILGPMTAWLGALVDHADDRAKDAKLKVAQLDLPPSNAPLPLRVLAARALISVKDRRGTQYLVTLHRELRKHPDILRAAEASRH